MIYKIGFEDYNSTIGHCLNYFSKVNEIQIDTETTGFDPYTEELLLLQLGDGINQFVINCTTVDIAELKEILEDENKLFIFQNAKFDLKWLYHHGINIKNVYDTFLAECILTAGIDRKDLRLSLDKLVKDYLNIDIDKSVRARISKNNFTTDEVIQYAATDVVHLSKIKEKQLVKLKEKELLNVLKLENAVVRVFARIELNGVLLNGKKWLEVADKVKENSKEIEKELNNIVLTDEKFKKFQLNDVQGDLFSTVKRRANISWTSNDQKLKLLQSIVKDLDSVNERSLQKNKPKHQIFKKLIEFSKSQKLESSFGYDFVKNINPVTNRVHYDVYQVLSTGRISVSNPNLNQIPSKGDLGKEIRSCFTVPEGYKLVGGDFSGMELRIIAQFSKDPLWIKAFNEGKDLHALLASKTFNIPIENVLDRTSFNKDVTYRDVQKTINFGLAYGMSKFKLADTIEITEEHAEDIINKFFGVVPQVRSFLDNLGNYGKVKGYIKTFKPFSRIRFFPKWEGDATSKKFLGEIERQSKNHPIQGCNGDIIKMVLVEVQKVIDENNYPVKILLSVYDEIQTECKEEFAEDWRIILENTMKSCAAELITDIPVKVDCKIVDYWQK